MAAITGSGIIMRQLFDRVSCTYSYLLADGGSRLALLIDPVRDLVQRDISLIQDLGLKLKYVLNTHVHADHVTGSGELKQRLEGVSSVISKVSGAAADILVKEGDVISCGESIKLTVMSTPGHTNGCVTYVDYGNRIAFTGDALLVRGCGRTDFQEGSAETLYQSIRGKVFQLPDDFLLYPAHDYRGFTVTSVAEEKAHNPRLTKSLHEFVDIMNNLNLDYPKMIDVAVPANLLCGIQEKASE